MLAVAASGARADWQLEDAALQPQFQSFTLEQGLPSNEVMALAEDARGAIWIATNSGVVRFDGALFHAMQPPGRAMPLIADALVTSPEGEVWVGGSEEGLWRYDLVTRTWRSYQVADGSLRSNDVWALARDQAGTVWAGSYLGGVVGIPSLSGTLPSGTGPSGTGQPLINVPGLDPKRSIAALAVVGDALWIGTIEGDVYRWVPGVPGAPAQACGNAGNIVIHLGAIEQGVIAHTVAGHAQSFRADRFGSCQAPELLYRASEPGQNSTFQLEQGAWMGFAHGLGRQVPGGYHVYRYRFGVPSSLPEGRVQAMLKDRSGGIWVGTPNGLAVLRPGYQRSLLLAHDPLSANALARVPPTGFGLSAAALWTGARGGGIVRVESTHAQRSQLLPDPNGRALEPRAFLQTGDQLWVGLSSGIQRGQVHADGSLHALRRLPTLEAKSVGFLLPWPPGLLAAVHGSGLFQLDTEGNVIAQQDFGSGLPGQEFIALRQESNAQLWLATDAGLYTSALTWPPKWQRLSARRVRSWCLAPDGIHAWVYLPGRIEQIQRSDGTLVWWRTADVPARDFAQLACANDSVWLFATGGSYQYPEQARGKARRFGVREGLGSVETRFARSSLIGPEHAWLGGRAGVVRWAFEAPQGASKPSLVLEHIGVSLLRNKRGLELHAERVDLRAGDRNALWQLRTITMAGPERSRYRVKMPNAADPSWQSLSRAEFALDALGVGEHELIMEATHPEHTAGSNPIRLQLVVWPDWHVSPVAYLAYAVFGLSAGWVAVTLLRRGRRRHAALDAKLQRADFATQLSGQRGRVLTQASHELRNLHAGIRGLAQLLLHQALPERAQRQANRLLTASDELGALLDDLLESARLERGSFATQAVPFSVPALLESECEALRNQAQARALSFEFAVLGEHAWRIGDPLRLKQVVLNLLGNAVKYCDQGGIRLTADLRAPEHVSISVEDSGPGIAVHLRASVFEPFALPRRSNDSTGLGLSLCKQIVERLGGELRFEALPRGARFVMRVPYAVVVAPQA